MTHSTPELEKKNIIYIPKRKTG